MVVDSASSSFESFLKSAILDKFFTHNSCARRPYASLRATPGCLLPNRPVRGIWRGCDSLRRQMLGLDNALMNLCRQ